MNVLTVKDCYGCGMCASVCPKNVLDIRLNKNGFYGPFVVDKDKCIDCGLCGEVCSFLHRDLSNIPVLESSFGAWSLDSTCRYACSSGGIGYEIARQLQEKGYCVYACRYNKEREIAEHYFSTVEDLKDSIGSKYIQSYTLDAFKKVNKTEKNLIIGTPCQIDSFRRYAKKFKCEDNFVFMDFFCHGVPSMFAWNNYLEIVKDKIGHIDSISWRNKRTGWHDSWAMAAKGDSDYYSRLSKGDIFYKLFLGDFCTNIACRKSCKYKYKSSSADIRIGDFWGNTYKDNEDGVSTAIAFTSVGLDILKNLNNCALEPYDFAIAAEGQMKHNAKTAFLSPLVMTLLRTGNSYKERTWHFIINFEKLFHIHKIIYYKFFKRK